MIIYTLCELLDMRYNVVFVGTISVGKTSLIRRYLNGDHDTSVTSTLAVDYFPIQIGDVELSVWDTAGQERFMSITSSYFSRGHVFVLVHDIETCQVEKDIQLWYKQIFDKRPARHEPVVIVASNKTDLHPFCSQEVTNWIKEHSFDHVYTSAITGEGIEKLFQKIHDAVVVHQSDWLAPSLPALPATSVSKTSPGCNC